MFGVLKAIWWLVIDVLLFWQVVCLQANWRSSFNAANSYCKAIFTMGCQEETHGLVAGYT